MPTTMTTIGTAALEQDDVEVDYFECPICYVDVGTSTTTNTEITLTTCQHCTCTQCLVKWIEKEEEAGEESPACPICRVSICEEDVHRIIGRSFEPRGVELADVNSEEIDEFTLHWLNENTVLCQGCGSRIEKESGCDLVECLCGYRFCYKCLAPGGRCECNEGHGFLGEEWGASEEYLFQPVRDSNGFVNLKSCIEHRSRLLDGEYVREDRYYRQQIQREEIEIFWGGTESWYWGSMEQFTLITACHGTWIFTHKTNEASARMLANISQAIDATVIRNRNSDADVDVGSTWLFLRKGADLRALKQLQNRHDKQSVRRYYWACDWDLYDSLKMLQGLCDGIEVRRQRCEMREATEEIPFNNGAWLFS